MIRNVNTTSNVASSRFLTDSTSYCSIWNNRVSYFSAPSGSLGLTATYGSYSCTLSWSLLSGVDKYYVNVTNVNGTLCDRGGIPFTGPYAYQRTYTEMVININGLNCGVPGPGTYSFQVVGVNNFGTTAYS
jgi:hypothetical protein